MNKNLTTISLLFLSLLMGISNSASAQELSLKISDDDILRTRPDLRDARGRRTLEINTQSVLFRNDGENTFLYGAGIKLLNNETYENFNIGMTKAVGNRFFTFDAGGSIQVMDTRPIIARMNPETGRPELIFRIQMMVRGEARHNLLRIYNPETDDSIEFRNTFFGVTPEGVASITRIEGNSLLSGSIHIGPTIGWVRTPGTAMGGEEVVGGQVIIQGLLKVKLKNDYSMTLIGREQLRLSIHNKLEAPSSSTTVMLRIQTPRIRNSQTRITVGAGINYSLNTDSNSSLGRNQNMSGFLTLGVSIGTRRGRIQSRRVRGNIEEIRRARLRRENENYDDENEYD